MPLIVQTSLRVNESLRSTMPGVRYRLGRFNSAGSVESIHLVPWRAAADKPATVARRPDQSQASTALSAGATVTPLGT